MSDSDGIDKSTGTSARTAKFRVGDRVWDHGARLYGTVLEVGTEQPNEDERMYLVRYEPPNEQHRVGVRSGLLYLAPPRVPEPKVWR